MISISASIHPSLLLRAKQGSCLAQQSFLRLNSSLVSIAEGRRAWLSREGFL